MHCSLQTCYSLTPQLSLAHHIRFSLNFRNYCSTDIFIPFNLPPRLSAIKSVFCFLLLLASTPITINFTTFLFPSTLVILDYNPFMILLNFLLSLCLSSLFLPLAKKRVLADISISQWQANSVNTHREQSPCKSVIYLSTYPLKLPFKFKSCPNINWSTICLGWL